MLFNVPRSFGRHDEGECYAIVLVDVLVVWREIFEMISGPFSKAVRPEVAISGGTTAVMIAIGIGDRMRDRKKKRGS